MTKQELLELIKESKDLGLHSLKIDGVEFEFETSNKQPQNIPVSDDIGNILEAKDLVALPNKYDELTDDEILFWSSDYGVELEAARKKEQQDELQRKYEDATRSL